MKINEVDLNSKDDIVFRFRKASSLIKHDELKKLEIYFCPFDEEDDAAEGLLNLYWKADEILWDNFIGHYFMVFYLYYSLMLFSDEKDRAVPDHINWRQSRSNFNIEGLILDLLSTEDIKLLKTMMMSDGHEIGTDEMKYYLQILHTAVLKFVWSIDHKDAIDDRLKSNNKKIDFNELSEALKAFKWNKANEDGVFHSLDRMLNRNKAFLVDENTADWKKWLFIDFPKHYYDCLMEMIFPKWYVASFCTDCTSKRNWAHYADSSKGICLIFKKHKYADAEGIRIKTCHQVMFGKNRSADENGRIYENHIEPLLDVEYADSFPKFNFFEMAGSMTGTMIDEWYHDKDGNISAYYPGDRNDPQRLAWHKKYWLLFQKHISQKVTDWENLKEQRVVLEDDDIFGTYRTDADRHIKYDFDELEGIIWGSRMNEREKREIRDIIEELCEQNDRTDFNFYQAVVDTVNGNVWIEKEI